jgi:hypothetical protein
MGRRWKVGFLILSLGGSAQELSRDSLDDFIASRQGVSASTDNASNSSPLDINDEVNMTKAQRIAAFRARNRNEAWKGVSTLKAVHLLSAEEILSLFGDVTAGLAFLVGLGSQSDIMTLTT